MPVLALAAASCHLDLLRLSGVVVGGSQAKLDLHLADLLDGELRQLISDLEGPLLLDVGFGKDNVNLFQITAGSLDIKEVGEGDRGKVDKGEEQVKAPCAPACENGGEHDNGEVVNPVGASGSRCCHGTGAKRIDLGRIDPRQR